MIKSFASPDPDAEESWRSSPWRPPAGAASFKKRMSVSAFVVTLEELAEFTSLASQAGAPTDAEVTAERLFGPEEIEAEDLGDESPYWNPLSVSVMWELGGTTPAEPTR